jgi:hypothetical protein
MRAWLRCDQCDTVLEDEHLERDRKRFCCADCAGAFDRGDLKSISPHDHHADAARQRQPTGAGRWV